MKKYYSKPVLEKFDKIVYKTLGSKVHGNDGGSTKGKNL